MPSYKSQQQDCFKNPSVQNNWEGDKIPADKTDTTAVRKKEIECNPLLAWL